MKWLLTRDVDDEALPGLQSTRLWLDLGGRIFRTTLGLHLQCNASARSRAESGWLRIENGSVQLSRESASVSVKGYGHVEIDNLIVENDASVSTSVSTSVQTSPVLSFHACAFTRLTRVTVRQQSAVANKCVLVECAGTEQALERRGGVSVYHCTFSTAGSTSHEIIGLSLTRLRCVRICRLKLECLGGTSATGVKVAQCSNCIVDNVEMQHSQPPGPLRCLRFEGECEQCALFDYLVYPRPCLGEEHEGTSCSPRSLVYIHSVKA